MELAVAYRNGSVPKANKENRDLWEIFSCACRRGFEPTVIRLSKVDRPKGRLAYDGHYGGCGVASVVAATFHKQWDAHAAWRDAETELAELRLVHTFIATCMASVIEDVAREKPKPCISPQIERCTQQASIDVSKLYVEGVPVHPMFQSSEFVECLCSLV
jgi:hypothetical protein